jgi:hypothetical protein
MTAPLAAVLCNTPAMHGLARTITVVGVLLPAAWLAASCKSESAAGAVASGAAAGLSSSAAPAATSSAELPPPDALDTSGLLKALKCTPKSEGGPCRVLNQFQSCQPAKIPTPSGDGRWLGNGYTVHAGAFTEHATMLRSRRVPQNEVGKSQLGTKIGVADLPADDDTLQRQAEKAIASLGRGDVPKHGNAAIDYLKELKDWNESTCMGAKDNQLFVVADPGIYLCELSDQRLLLVQRTGGSADGLYAELWPVSW